MAASEAALDAKLERKRAELMRAEKRLHTVQKIELDESVSVLACA